MWNYSKHLPKRMLLLSVVMADLLSIGECSVNFAQLFASLCPFCSCDFLGSGHRVASHSTTHSFCQKETDTASNRCVTAVSDVKIVHLFWQISCACSNRVPFFAINFFIDGHLYFPSGISPRFTPVYIDTIRTHRLYCSYHHSM